MLRQLTISEAIFAGVLCLFAMGTARAPNSAATDYKNEYKLAIAHANADYKATKNASEPRQGNDQDGMPIASQAVPHQGDRRSEGAAEIEHRDADACKDTQGCEGKVRRVGG